MGWPLRMTLTVALLSLPVAVYVALRAGAAIRVTTGIRARWTRLASLAALVPVYVFPALLLVAHLTGAERPAAAEVLPVPLAEVLPLYLFWWGVIVVLESLPYIVLLDLTLIPLLWNRQARWREHAAVLRLTVLALVLVYVPVRSGADTMTVRRSAVTVTVDGLPPALEGLRIGLIADVQFDQYTGETKARAMRSILEESDPELVLFAGDLVTSGRAFVPLGVRSLCPPPVPGRSIAVIGDHDYWSDRRTIPTAMRACGWTFLENDTATVRVRGEPVRITGVTHVYSSRLDSLALDTLLAAPRGDGLRILLTHQPATALVAAASARGVDLVLAGHTHGGQIVFRPFGIPVTPSRFETLYVSGYYRRGPTSVVVTNGIGFTLTPVRYQAPAEVTTVTLHRRAEEGDAP